MGVEIQRKYFKFQVKSVDEAGRFSGYASVFGIVDSYGDVVQKGAFKKTLLEQTSFPLLWSHDVGNPIGICSGREDARGLYIEGELNLEVQRAREIHALMRQGAVRGLSIGYTTIKEDKDEEGNRLLKEIRLWEVSLVVFPANQAAMVIDVRSMGEFQEETIELKPYPNEHAARLLDPDQFDRFRRTRDGKLWNRIKVPNTVFVIWGRFKNSDDWAAQALRFPVKDWTADEALKWLKENEVDYMEFEPASQDEKAREIEEQKKAEEERKKLEMILASLRGLNDRIKSL